MQFDGTNDTVQSKIRLCPMLRHTLGIGLLVTGVFLLPSVAAAQPVGIPSCPENETVAPFVNVCVVPAGTSVVNPGGVNCGGGPGDVCPGFFFGINCFESLDDAVNLSAPGFIPAFPAFPHPPQPQMLIGVFGPTRESVGGNKIGIGNNVQIDRGRFFPPVHPYPLVIEECHNAKIGGAGVFPGLPVIEIFPVCQVGGCGNPIGPVLINGVEVAGGAEGVRVGTVGSAQQPGTTLKAVRAELNALAGIFTGAGFMVTGNFNLVDGCTAESNDKGFSVTGDHNTLTNTNRALKNIFDGFEISGNRNLVRGNIAESNGILGFFNFAGFTVAGNDNVLQDNRSNKNAPDGFFVSVGGGGNTLQKNRAETNARDGFRIEGGGNFIGTSKGGNIALNNFVDGFSVPGINNVFDKNQATCNKQDGFDVAGGGNSLDNSRSCGNAVNQIADFEYRIGAGNVDSGGNRVCNTPFGFGAGGVNKPRTVKACFGGGGTGGTGANASPTASLKTEALIRGTGQPSIVLLDGSASADKDGAIVSYKFQVVDKRGNVVVFDPPAGPAAIEVTPAPGLFPGDYVATLVVTDDKQAVSKPASRGFSVK